MTRITATYCFIPQDAHRYDQIFFSPFLLQNVRGQSIIRAAVADESPAVAANRKKAEKGVGFYTGEDGYMYCDNLKVEDIRQQVP